jgi:ubiquinone/menaquinone biosynthesis C-methylase UbiE
MKREDEYAQGDPYQVEDHFFNPFHQRRLQVTLNLIKDSCDKKSNILDIGCGEGHITNAIKDLPGVKLVWGMDYSFTAIRKSVKNYPSVNFCVADAYELPFSDGFFDIAVCNNIWEHVPDPLNLLKDVSRILSNNGYLVISTPSLFRYDNLLKIIRRLGPQKISHHHVTEYTIGQVMDQLAFGGYDILRVTSRPLPIQGRNFLFTLTHKLLKSLFTFCFRLYQAEQSLESTVFILAKKTTQSK